MCGIYGILSLDGHRRHDPSVLARMGDAIVQRGPDDSGAFVDDADNLWVANTVHHRVLRFSNAPGICLMLFAG